MNPDDVKKVGVIGCGIMGSGICEVIARSGGEVVYVEVDEERVARGRGRIERSTGTALERGKLSEGDREALLGRVTGTTTLDDVADADLVIEAATEDLETKLQIFRRLDEMTRPEIVLATNTSSLPIAELAAATKRPDRVIGMHFFNPPPIMKLLEVIRAITTSDETLEDGVATKEDIDTAVQLGLGHPMGPLTLLDLIGLDTAVHVSNVLYDEFKDPIYAAPTLLKRMVAAGYLGRKSGKGFYDYAGGDKR
jgi:3-hydroxybutyryl-CoA dehydrogenase